MRNRRVVLRNRRSDSGGAGIGKPLVRRVAMVATVAVAAGVLGFIPGSSDGVVGAQSVENLRASAKRAADELSRLQTQSDELNEKYLQLQEELAALAEKKAENTEAVESARARLDQARSEASDYLVEAYVSAGTNDAVVVGSADPNEAVSQRVLLSMLRNDRVQLADGLEVLKSDLDNLTQELETTSADLEKRSAEQKKVVDELDRSVANQQQILNGANQALNEAIRAEQARREAEAAAKAQREAAAAAARQQAQAQAQARTQTQTRNTAASGSTSTRSTTAPSTSTRSNSQSSKSSAPAFTAPPVVAPPSSGAAGAIAAAKSRLGTPYRYGGSTPAGFDCSGLMMWSWAQVGVSLPRTSGAQRAATQRISYDQLQPGDLVFSGNPVSHVGMYIGGGQMIHSPHTGDVVRIAPVRAGGSTSYGRIR